MRTIPLTKGYVAIVDDDDYDAVAQFKWTAVVTGQTIKRVYAYRREGWDNANRKWRSSIYLHRAILNVPKGTDVDHINSNTLDNRRSNLREASRSQNLANNRRPIGVTGYRGVTPTKSGERAPYKVQCRGRYVGAFYDLVEAAKAYDKAAVEEFGEFAKLNFPMVAPDRGAG